jgi:hypothetical protein
MIMDYYLLKSYTDENFTTRGIAERLQKSQSTISYWLKKYNLKTSHKQIETHKKMNTNCVKCGIVLNESTGYWRKESSNWKNTCKKCHSAYCTEYGVDKKKKAVQYKGGKCERCGYDKFYGALDFHHLNPNEKEFDWSQLKSFSWNIIQNELDKCICVCSNCHREIHHEIKYNMVV